MILHSRFEGADVAADIIGAGPEPLTSQFAAGYGMVLNLLHTRSLEEARAFLERSFGNYMGGSWGHGSICELPPDVRRLHPHLGTRTCYTYRCALREPHRNLPAWCLTF